MSSLHRLTDGGKEGVWVKAVDGGVLGPVLGPSADPRGTSGWEVSPKMLGSRPGVQAITPLQ